MKGKTIEVVAALIWDGESFLICQRPEGKARALLWEFVGGKVEEGESFESALVRECREELDITVEVGEIFTEVTHEYPDITVHLTLFNAKVKSGTPALIEHNDMRWITPSMIDDFEFCPADEIFLKRLKELKLSKAGSDIKRCSWVNLKNPIYIDYHDNEWGVVEHRDDKLYELLILESFQAGLSWECILNKRENFRQAFDGFDIEKVISYGEDKISELMENKGIIRNRRKIEAAVSNSRAFKRIQAEFGSFDSYIWSFSGGKTVIEDYTLRTTSQLSDEISADLKARGMSFVGSTIIYSYLQSMGIINGHGKECDKYIQN